MTKVLGDIINKRHEKEACRFNCLENGKAFNQAPHHCPYFSNDFKYANLLEHKDVKGDDDVDGKVSVGANNAKIAEFCLNLIILEDLKDDLIFGCRQEEDLIGVKSTIGTL